MKTALHILLMAGLVWGGALLGQAAGQTVAEVPLTFASVPFAQLTDKNITEDGRRALAIRPQEWKHAETAHFVLHYFHSFIAAPVSVEAEFYYRYIIADLELEGVSASAPGKTHVYLFETREDWTVFRAAATLEDWTGAVHIDGALFLPRYPEYKWKGDALGHEISHLLVSQFLGRQMPLWVKEGYAEDVSSRGNSAFYRARGYLATPRELIPPGWMPLARLTSLTAYPPGTEVRTFYRESRALIAFITREGGKPQFIRFFKAMAMGTPFPDAFKAIYGSRWSSIEALETGFKPQMGN